MPDSGWVTTIHGPRDRGSDHRHSSGAARPPPARSARRVRAGVVVPDDRCRPGRQRSWARLAPAEHVAGQVQSSRQAVRHHVDRVLSASRTTLRKSPVEGVAQVAKATVRTQVTKVVETTRSAPATAPVVPTLSAQKKAAKKAEEAKQPARESSTGQGKTHSSNAEPQHHAAPSSANSAAAVEGPPTLAGTTFTDADRAAPSSPVGEGSGSTTRTCSTSSGASAQPGSGNGAGAGVTGNGLRLVSPTTHTSSTSLTVRHSAGPAYPPGSSPD